MIALAELLRRMSTQGARSLQLRPGQPPYIFQGSQPEPTDEPILSAEITKSLAYQILSSAKQEELEVSGQVDGIHSVSGLGIFDYRIRKIEEGLAMAFRVGASRSRNSGVLNDSAYEQTEEPSAQSPAFVPPLLGPYRRAVGLHLALILLRHILILLEFLEQFLKGGRNCWVL